MPAKKGRTIKKTPPEIPHEKKVQLQLHHARKEVERQHRSDFPDKIWTRIRQKEALTGKMTTAQIINFETIGRSKLKALNNVYQILQLGEREITAPSQKEYEHAKAKTNPTLADELIIDFAQVYKKNPKESPKTIWIRIISNKRAEETEIETRALIEKLLSN